MKDILETLQALQDTPVPNLFIIGGLFFLSLAFIGQFGTTFTVPKERQKTAGLIGVLLLILGVVLFVLPPTSEPSAVADTGATDTPMPSTDTPESPTDTPEPPTDTPPPPPSETPLPDLLVSELSLDPATPMQGDPVQVRIGVYNQGTGAAGPFSVGWWPGEDYPVPACTWRVEGLAARGGQIITCVYGGYPSWYPSIVTKAEVDFEEEVAESTEENNREQMTISVSRPSAVRVVFDAWPDGTPIDAGQVLGGDEYLAKGIRLGGAPEGSYCADATAAAIRRPGTYSGVDFPFLTTARPDAVNACNSIPVAIDFVNPVRRVTLTFAGASATYTMRVYDSGGVLLGSVEEDAVAGSGTFEVTFTSADADVSRVTFGRPRSITIVKEIYYEP